LVTLHLEAEDAPAHGGASVMQAGRVVGTVTSGGYGHRVGRNLAYAFVLPEAATATDLTIDVLGALVPATVCDSQLYDPEMVRVRS
jgi:dimethylglycine dehydrogenase